VIAMLDVETKVTAGSVDNFVYRVKYGRAEMLAVVIMSLYMGGGYGGPAIVPGKMNAMGYQPQFPQGGSRTAS
jgi:hypothetical protein